MGVLQYGDPASNADERCVRDAEEEVDGAMVGSAEAPWERYARS